MDRMAGKHGVFHLESSLWATSRHLTWALDKGCPWCRLWCHRSGVGTSLVGWYSLLVGDASKVLRVKSNLLWHLNLSSVVSRSLILLPRWSQMEWGHLAQSQMSIGNKGKQTTANSQWKHVITRYVEDCFEWLAGKAWASKRNKHVLRFKIWKSTFFQ